MWLKSTKDAAPAALPQGLFLEASGQIVLNCNSVAKNNQAKKRDAHTSRK